MLKSLVAACVVVEMDSQVAMLATYDHAKEVKHSQPHAFVESATVFLFQFSAEVFPLLLRSGRCIAFLKDP